MAMTFDFNLHPFGYGVEPIKFGHMRVHSDRDYHSYEITYKTKGKWRALRGTIKKRMPDGSKRSGHRNFLHLIQDILADANLDSLGQDYVNVVDDVREATGLGPNIGIGDYPKED